MTAASTPPSSISAIASAGVKCVTWMCDWLLGNPLPQVWIWASMIGIADASPYGVGVMANLPARSYADPQISIASIKAKPKESHHEGRHASRHPECPGRGRRADRRLERAGFPLAPDDHSAGGLAELQLQRRQFQPGVHDGLAHPHLRPDPG